GFVLTIQSNQTDHKYIELLRQASLYIARHMIDYIKYVNRAPEPEMIEAIRVDGPRNYEPDYSMNHRKDIHIHLAVRIKHNSKVQLDCDKMVPVVANMMGLHNVYINAQYRTPAEIENNLLPYIDRHLESNERILKDGRSPPSK